MKRVRSVFEDPNIVGVGISEKTTGRGVKTGELSVCFYVEKKVAQSKMHAGKLVPPVMSAPNGTAVFTDVKAIGRVRPEANKKVSPIQSGFSVGHVDVTAGTVGAIVKKGKKLYILSNSHVLADAGLGKVKDKVLYPGPADGGKLPETPRRHACEIHQVQGRRQVRQSRRLRACEIDAARLDDLDLSIFGVKGLPKTIKANRGMVVMKRGRTTGETKARSKT